MTRLRDTTHFNQRVGVDLFETELADGVKITGVNILELHTTMQMVGVLNKPMRRVTAEDVLVSFENTWSGWALTPEAFRFDSGRHFRGILREFAGSMDIPVEDTGVECHWQAGAVEVAGRVWREGFQRVVRRNQIDSRQWHRVELAAQGMNRGHNARSTKDGFGPMQWLRGRNIPLPTSLTDSSDILAAQHAIHHGSEAFRDRLDILKDADVSWVKADNSSRVRRSVQSRVRPTRGPFCSGA